MNILTNAKELFALAFGKEEAYNVAVITENDILVAESRHVCPVLGEALVAALARGEYEALRSDYVVPAVAAWVRYIVEPHLAERCSHCSATSSKDEELLGLRLAHLRRHAQSLTRRLSDVLNRNEASYAEHNPEVNPLNHCSIDGGIVQIF